MDRRAAPALHVRAGRSDAPAVSVCARRYRSPAVHVRAGRGAAPAVRICMGRYAALAVVPFIARHAVRSSRMQGLAPAARQARSPR
ncbi:hypothetical protein [Sorangium sp. So ce406]|uniref:hypothetical protein n=1 Tax=Sorangium sp. So ce406 TaxID=3133311 RepID=UPI003F5B4F5D